MKKKMMIFLLIFFGTSFLNSQFKVEASGTSFSITPVFPENQRNKEKSYFDLRMDAGTEQIIEVAITNALSEEQTIVVDSSAARSNQNGIIEYKSDGKMPDNSLIINFPDIINFQEEIKVPANATVNIPIKIDLPEQKFDGIILGGITFQAKVSDLKEEKKQIANKFAYSIAVMISQNDIQLLPKLNLQSVEVTQSNLRNVITAIIQNEKATIVENLDLEAYIYRDNKNNTIYHKKEESFRMAPNSSLPFVIDTNDKPLKAGNYILKMTAKSNEQIWEWKEPFKIEPEKANELNLTAVSLDEDNTPIYVLIGIALVSIIFILIVILFKKSKL